jgi:hypothetical protein
MLDSLVYRRIPQFQNGRLPLSSPWLLQGFRRNYAAKGCIPVMIEKTELP